MLQKGCWRWCLRVGLACGLALWLCHPAAGFVLDDTLTNNTPDYLADDLQGAARWSNIPGSVVSNVRGLGEGLEYAIAPQFCDQIIPLFEDRQPPTCSQIRTEIQKAFAQWGQNHALLKFTNVSSSLTAQLPPEGTPDPWRGFGAEIDLFVLSPRAYPLVADFGARTSFWYTDQQPIGAQGRPLPGKTITNADIVFNNQSCYFLDAQTPIQECNHFESLLIHEVGHALALDHPNQFPQRNFDTDNIAGNAISIDCQNPTKTLALFANHDPQAIMNSSLGQATTVQPQLSPDDLGGRDFLYPICTGILPHERLRPWQLFVLLLLGSFISVFGLAAIIRRLRKRRRP